MTDPSAEALEAAAQVFICVMDRDTRRNFAFALDRFGAAAYRRGYERARGDAVRVAGLWRGLKGPSVAEKIGALAPPQEGS